MNEELFEALARIIWFCDKFENFGDWEGISDKTKKIYRAKAERFMVYFSFFIKQFVEIDRDKLTECLSNRAYTNWKLLDVVNLIIAKEGILRVKGEKS